MLPFLLAIKKSFNIIVGQVNSNNMLKDLLASQSMAQVSKQLLTPAVWQAIDNHLKSIDVESYTCSELDLEELEDVDDLYKDY